MQLIKELFSVNEILTVSIVSWFVAQVLKTIINFILLGKFQLERMWGAPLLDAGEAGEKAHTVRLGGPTCLAGDIIGDYSFDTPLAEGDKLIFGDMAIYTTCKNNTFNGMPLPPIWLLGADGNCRELVHFGYQDFKMRLGAQ